jgi:serine/threonine protein phosphatase Stp1
MEPMTPIEGIEGQALAAGRFRSWAATHPGARRSNNEDQFVNRPDLGIWAVADGAGGHQAGDVASGTIADALQGMPLDVAASEMLTQVRGRIAGAHEALRAEAARRGEGAILAAALVVLLARGEHFACLWAGDSRAYLLRDGALTQVTSDHSLVQEMLDAGAITPDEARTHPNGNVITRAVGAEPEALELEKITDRLQENDRFLLCSDGLCKTLPEDELSALLTSPDPASPAELLVAAALAREAGDNVTAVVVEVV